MWTSDGASAGLSLFVRHSRRQSKHHLIPFSPFNLAGLLYTQTRRFFTLKESYTLAPPSPPVLTAACITPSTRPAH